jgi:hypothetical protein
MSGDGSLKFWRRPMIYFDIWCALAVLVQFLALLLHFAVNEPTGEAIVDRASAAATAYNVWCVFYGWAIVRFAVFGLRHCVRAFRRR